MEGRFYITAGIGFTNEADSEYRIRLYILGVFKQTFFTLYNICCCLKITLI